MPAINFLMRYADAIESGAKVQTVRKPRRDGRPHAREGDPVSLYVGMRTKSCRKLREVVCTGRHAIDISEAGMVFVDGALLDANALERFARADGFDSRSAFVRFFRETHGLPFHGSVIRWNPGPPVWAAIESHQQKVTP